MTPFSRTFPLAAALALLLAAFPAASQQATATAPETAQPASMPVSHAISTGRTSGGIRLVHMRLPDEKSQTFAAVWNDRHAINAPAKAGLLMLAPRLLITGGSTALDGGAIEEDLKDLGAAVQLSRNLTYTFGEISGPAATFGDAAKIAESVLREPRLPARNLDRLKRASLNGLRASRERGEAVASLALSLAVIGQQPLRTFYTFEPESTIADITTDDVREWRGKVLARDNLTVVAAGPMAREEAAATVDRTFGHLPAKAAIAPVVAFEPTRQRRTIVIERDVEQSIIVMGQSTRWNGTTEGQARALAMSVLGQGFASRIFRAIRERLGAAYGASAGVSPITAGHNLFSMQSSVAHDKLAPAIDAMRQEYAAFLDKGVTAAEIDPLKRRMLAGQSETMRRASSAANAIRGSITNGAPFDFADSYAQRLAEVNADTVNELIRRHLNDQLVTIVVTPSAAGIAADCVIKEVAQLEGCSKP